MSGGNTARPQYQRLWRLIEAERIDGVVAKDISRLNRSLGDFCELIKHCRSHGVKVYLNNLDIDQDGPSGDMILKLLALVAEFERTMGVQRTRDGIRASMMHKNNIHGGRVLLGFDRAERGKWRPNTEELKLVDRVLDLVPQYDGYPSACRAIALEGIHNKYGGPITKDGLRRMMLSRKYEGINEVRVAVGPPTQNSKDIKREKIGERPLGCGAVVDLAKLERARLRLTEWDQSGNKTRRRNRTNILHGLIQYEDGSEFKGNSGTARNGEMISYYQNRKHGVSLIADELEAKIIESISCYKDDQEIQGYVSEAVRQFSKGIESLQTQIGQLQGDLRDLCDRERGLVDGLKHVPSNRVASFLEEQLNKIDADRKQLEVGIARLEREKLGLQGDLPNPRNMKATLQFVFENFGKAEGAVKRNFMRQLFEKIVVYSDNRVGLFWRFPEMTNPANTLRDTGGHLQGLSKY